MIIATYCTRMAGGFLRFQAQYLRRLRLPRWERVSEANRAALRAADGFDDMDVVDAPVFALFGLSEEEGVLVRRIADEARSEEHTSELQSLMRISYAVFCLKKTKKTHTVPPRQP